MSVLISGATRTFGQVLEVIVKCNAIVTRKVTRTGVGSAVPNTSLLEIRQRSLDERNNTVTTGEKRKKKQFRINLVDIVVMRNLAHKVSN